MSEVRQPKAGVRVVTRHAYFDRPYPLAFLWINGRLFDSYPCGVMRKRVKWLPLWLPFNARWDFSPIGQYICTRRLEEFGRQIAAELEEDRNGNRHSCSD